MRVFAIVAVVLVILSFASAEERPRKVEVAGGSLTKPVIVPSKAPKAATANANKKDTKPATAAKPASKAPAGKPAAKTANKPAVKTTNKAAAKTTNKAANKPASKAPAAKPAGKAAPAAKEEVITLPVVKVAPKVVRSRKAKANPNFPGPPKKSTGKAASKDVKKATTPSSGKKTTTVSPPRFTAALVRRDKMQMTLQGWLDDFFSKFFEIAQKLTAAVKQRISGLVSAVEATIATYVNAATEMWKYFQANGIEKGIKDLWFNTRCDICQAGVLHIYRRGCDYAKQGICTIVSQVACGAYASLCQKAICPLLNKFFLDKQCSNLLDKLNSAVAKNPLDNFATLAVCRRFGLCKEFDEPFDGPLFAAIVDQAKKLRLAAQGKTAEKDIATAVQSVISQPAPVVIPSAQFDQPGTYVLPGLGCKIHIWINNQINSDRYGKPYYILDNMSGPTDGIEELLWLDKIDGATVDALGPQGVLERLTSPAPGTKLKLSFIKSGFFGLSAKAYIVTVAQWPVTLVSVGRE